MKKPAYSADDLDDAEAFAVDFCDALTMYAAMREDDGDNSEGVDSGIFGVLDDAEVFDPDYVFAEGGWS